MPSADVARKAQTMTDHPAAVDSDTSPDQHDSARLARRGLLRGGAVLAGAAGLAAASAVAGATPAQAANGDPVAAGQATTATTTTTLSIGASTQPTLSLQNTNGPAMQLSVLPDSFAGTLAVGQLATKATGPIVGVNYGAGPTTAFLATEIDLQLLPLPVAIAPERLLDTRSVAGRQQIIATSSSGALDSAGRLVSGQWIDIALAPVDEATIDAVFANLTVTGSLSAGFLTVYPSGPRPSASALNFTKGQTIANGGFFGTGEVAGYSTVRISASSTTHVIFDLTGFVGPQIVAPAAAAAADKAATVSKARRSAARRTVRSMARR